MSSAPSPPPPQPPPPLHTHAPAVGTGGVVEEYSVQQVHAIQEQNVSLQNLYRQLKREYAQLHVEYDDVVRRADEAERSYRMAGSELEKLIQSHLEEANQVDKQHQQMEEAWGQRKMVMLEAEIAARHDARHKKRLDALAREATIHRDAYLKCARERDALRLRVEEARADHEHAYAELDDQLHKRLDEAKRRIRKAKVSANKDDLMDQIHDMELQCKELIQRNNELMNEVGEANRQRDRATTEVDVDATAHVAAVGAARARGDELAAEKALLERRVADMTAENGELRAEVCALDAQVKELQLSNAAYNGRVDALEQQYRVAISSRADEAAATEAKHQQQCDTLRLQVSGLRDELSARTGECETVKKAAQRERESLESRSEALALQQAQIDERLSGSEGKAAAARADGERAMTLATARHAQAMLAKQDEVDVLDARVRQEMQRRAKMEGTVAELTQDVATVERARQAAVSRMRQLEAEAAIHADRLQQQSGMEAERNRLSTDLQKALDTVAATQRDRDACAADVSRLTDEADACTKALARAKGDKAKYKKMCVDLRDGVNEAAKRDEQYRLDVAALLQTKSDEIDSLHRQLLEAEGQRNELKLRLATRSEGVLDIVDHSQQHIAELRRRLTNATAIDAIDVPATAAAAAAIPSQGIGGGGGGIGGGS